MAAEVKVPLLLGGATEELSDRDFLAAHNVRVCLQGHAPFSAAVFAVYETLKALRQGTAPRELKNIASPELMRQLTRADDYQRWTREFLGGA